MAIVRQKSWKFEHENIKTMVTEALYYYKNNDKRN